MDVSVLAAVGSFVVSERVLKPKATVLVCLGCVLAYDLTTKTHDPSSLRVYRGPALLAFTLMMCAYSLRTWRRNGIACDELLFLPGTPHGERHGVVETGTAAAAASHDVHQHNHHQQVICHTTSYDKGNNNNNNHANLRSGSAHIASPRSELPIVAPIAVAPPDEGDVAAGVVGFVRNELNLAFGGFQGLEMMNIDRTASNISSNSVNVSAHSNRVRARTLSKESPSLSARDFTDSWYEDDDEAEDFDVQNLDNDEENRLPIIGSNNNNIQESANLLTRSRSSSLSDDSLQLNIQTLEQDNQQQEQQQLNDNNTSGRRSPVERLRDYHPRIVRVGSFFFFRNSTSSTQNAAYAPSGPMVVGAALDLSIPILFNFHLFIEAYNHIAAYGSEAPAKILPLIFLSVLIVRSMIPPGRRGRFWGTLRFTLMAPFYQSRFRDGFVGDVLTSLVRPIQDVLFALSYYVTVIFGTITGTYGLSESGHILQSSWLLYNVVLPSCALLPLWWKFLQTLRESYDTGKRWPYLGNAFKYMSAAMIVLYGMTHQEDSRSTWWYVCFVFAILYQIWWDVFMDWELIVIAPRLDERVVECENKCFTQPSSYRPDSASLVLQRYLVQPLQNLFCWISVQLPSWKQIQLRERRLYKSESFYWKILAYNVVFRFAWMVCFIPAYHFSASGNEQYTTFSSDTNSYIGVLLPVAEILRRTLWGFLYLEMQTIRMQDGGGASAYACLNDYDDENIDELSDNIAEVSQRSSTSIDSRKSRFLPEWFSSSRILSNTYTYLGTSEAPTNLFTVLRTKMAECLRMDRESVSALLFTFELTLWVVAFLGLGLWSTM